MYYTVIKHSGHLRTLEKCRKHSPAACVFYISLVFSNGRRVLSQCNTRLRLLYLLNNNTTPKRECTINACSFHINGHTKWFHPDLKHRRNLLLDSFHRSGYTLWFHPDLFRLTSSIHLSKVRSKKVAGFAYLNSSY